jgi:hypothetical protein
MGSRTNILHVITSHLVDLQESNVRFPVRFQKITITHPSKYVLFIQLLKCPIASRVRQFKAAFSDNTVLCAALCCTCLNHRIIFACPSGSIWQPVRWNTPAATHILLHRISRQLLPPDSLSVNVVPTAFVWKKTCLLF